MKKREIKADYKGEGGSSKEKRKSREVGWLTEKRKEKRGRGVGDG